MSIWNEWERKSKITIHLTIIKKFQLVAAINHSSQCYDFGLMINYAICSLVCGGKISRKFPDKMSLHLWREICGKQYVH